MGSHSLFSRRALAASGIVAITAGTCAPIAGADDVDALIKQLEEVSHQATAKSEEIKALEVEVEESERKIADADQRAATARAEAEKARGAKTGFQRNVNDLAQSKYRNTDSEVFLTCLLYTSPSPRD